MAVVPELLLYGWWQDMTMGHAAVGISGEFVGLGAVSAGAVSAGAAATYRKSRRSNDGERGAVPRARAGEPSSLPPQCNTHLLAEGNLGPTGHYFGMKGRDEARYSLIHRRGKKRNETKGYRLHFPRGMKLKHRTNLRNEGEKMAK
jgi:hypothetical protein